MRPAWSVTTIHSVFLAYAPIRAPTDSGAVRADNADRAKSHGEAGDHRTQERAEERIEHSRCDWNSQCVIDERKEQILPDVAHGGATQAARLDDAAQIAFDQRHSRAFHRNVGA